MIDFEETEAHRWRLRVERGRQTWHYLSEAEAAADPMDGATLHALGRLKVSDASERAGSAIESARRGLRHFTQSLTQDGHWAGEYGGKL